MVCRSAVSCVAGGSTPGIGVAISSLARAMLASAGAGQQPVMADAMKPLWQNVEQEAPDELVGAECHCPVSRRSVAAVIIVPEGHATLVESNEPAVRDGDVMGVAGEIGKHCFWAREGRLGVDKPILSFEAARDAR